MRVGAESPDRSPIVYEDATERAPIVTVPSGDVDPTWSAGGSSIVFSSDRS